MAINVNRAFASVGLQAGPGVFAPDPLPSGNLEATKAVGGAVTRQFEAAHRAIDLKADAAVRQAEAIGELGQSMTKLGGTLVAIDQQRQKVREQQQAHTAYVDLVSSAGPIYEKGREDAGPDARNLAQNHVARLQARSQEIMDALPATFSTVSRADLRQRFDLFIAREGLEARKEEHRLSAAYITQKLDHDLAKLGTAAVATEPGPWQAEMIATGMAEIIDLGAHGGLSELQVQQKLKAFRTTVLSGAIQAQAARDPAAGLQALEAGVYDQLIANDSEREAAHFQLAEAARLREREARKAAAAQYVGQLEQFEQLEPNVLQIEAAYANGNGWLQRVDHARLRKAAGTRERTAQTEADNIERIRTALGRGQGFDPQSPEDRLAVDQYFRQVAPMLADTANPVPALARFAVRVGMVPDSLLSSMRGTLRAGDAAAKVRVAQLIDLAAADLPQILDDFDPTTRTYLTMLGQLTATGMPPEAAVERADEAVYRPDGPTRQFRKEQLDRQFGLDPLAQSPGYLVSLGEHTVPNMLRNSFVSSARRIVEDTGGRFVDYTDLPDELMHEYRFLAREHYLASGDFGVAGDAAFRDLRRVWGVTEIGDRRVVKYPPEMMYGRPGEDTGWIEKQLHAGVLGLPGIWGPDPEKRLRLVTDTQSAHERHPETGAFWPSYAVMIADPDTDELRPVLDDDGQPMRWRPDWARHAGGKASEPKSRRLIDPRRSLGSSKHDGAE